MSKNYILGQNRFIKKWKQAFVQTKGSRLCKASTCSETLEADSILRKL